MRSVYSSLTSDDARNETHPFVAQLQLDLAYRQPRDQGRPQFPCPSLRESLEQTVQTDLDCPKRGSLVESP
ncbi:hypothetical protein D3C87_1920760 [compost metagenome]